MSSRRRLLGSIWRVLLLVLWMGLIFWLSDQPVLPHPVRQYGISDFLYDSAAHSFFYGVLTLLAYRALAGRGPRRAVWAALLALTFGASDEWHQSFVAGRTATVADWAMDALGAALAVCVLFLWRRYGAARWRRLTRRAV